MGDIFGLVIVRPLGLILLGIFKLIGNYGLAVILFALLVKLLCMPLTIKSKKSMLKMSAMNAELQQLQKRYANNRVKLNEEMTKLYEKHGVSPTSGCLPQMIPLFIMMGLYYAVQQPLKFMLGFSDEVIGQLANLVGVNMDVAGYYGQITVAEKLGQMFQEAGGVWPDAVTAITTGQGELLNIDFSFLGLNLAQTPSITDPQIIWIIRPFGRDRVPVQLYHAEDAGHELCRCQPDAHAEHPHVADVAVFCVHHAGCHRRLLGIQQRVHLRAGNRADQVPARQAGAQGGGGDRPHRSGKRSQACSA